MERLSLHQLAAIGASPSELLDIAARLNCPTVTLFTIHSVKSNAPFVETLAQAKALRRQSDDIGVGIYSLEAFSLDENGVTDSFRSALEIAGELGAKRTTLCVYDDDTNRARDNFDAFVPLAASHGLDVHVEFHAFGTLNTLPQTREFLSGVSSKASISADVLHFYRNEGGLDSLMQPHPVPIGHAQLCDGPLVRPKDEWLHEAVADRRLPGEGELDLITFLRALPPEVRIDIEAPTDPKRMPGATNFERCEAALTAARSVLAAAAQSADQS